MSVTVWQKNIKVVLRTPPQFYCGHHRNFIADTIAMGYYPYKKLS